MASPPQSHEPICTDQLTNNQSIEKSIATDFKNLISDASTNRFYIR